MSSKKNTMPDNIQQNIICGTTSSKIFKNYYAGQCLAKKNILLDNVQQNLKNYYAGQYLAKNNSLQDNVQQN